MKSLLSSALFVVCASSFAQAPVWRLREGFRDVAKSPAPISAPSAIALETATLPRVEYPLPGIWRFPAESRVLAQPTAPRLPDKEGRVAALSAPFRARVPPVVSPESARHAAASLAYDLLQDGEGDPHSSEWRPYLAELIARPRRDVDVLAMYRLFLASFDGIDSRSRMTPAENWAMRYDGGRYAGAIALASLRLLFQSEVYDEVESRALRVAADHPALAAQALSLRVLCLVYRNNLATADESVAALLRDFKGTSDEPEVLYLAAWLRIEQNRIDEARQMLQNVRDSFPGTPAAKKARSALEELPL